MSISTSLGLSRPSDFRFGRFALELWRLTPVPYRLATKIVKKILDDVSTNILQRQSPIPR